MIYRVDEQQKYERTVFADTATINLINYDEAMINAYLDLGHGMYLAHL